jgi:adapter protein MecA 1/2
MMISRHTQGAIFMRLEKISENQIKFSIDVNELEDKGIFDEEQWKDSFVWHDLFEDMLDEIQKKFGFEAQMEVTVEIESVNDTEICLILTLDSEDDFTEGEGRFPTSTIDELTSAYEFNDFEDVISMFLRLDTSRSEAVGACSLYSWKNLYIIIYENLPSELFALVDSLGTEYGRHSNYTIHMVKEYGMPILLKNTMKTIKDYFS